MNQEDLDKQQTIVFMVGLPGSGKSTWVKNFLSKNPSFVVLSTDDIIETWAAAVGKTYSEVFPKYMSTAEVLYKKNMFNAIRDKKNIVVDRTNMTIKSRRKILSIVPKTYKKIAVTFEVPMEEIKKRLLQREYETGKSIPDSVLDNFAKSYQPPTLGEGFDEIQKA